MTPVIVLLLAIPIGLIVFVCKLYNDDAKLEKARKEEEERLRKIKEEEQERLKKIKCNICHNTSMGAFICESCKTRAEIIEDEIPKEKIKTYKTNHNYQIELMYEAINTKDNFIKEYCFLQLINSDEIMKEFNDYNETALRFIEDFNKKTDKETLIEKYNITNRTQNYDNKKGEEKNNNKEFKCLDGHIVKSKAEREIDNFFFNNDIWHIYEYSYRHPISYETSLPDFYLPDYNLFIEYFGLNTDKYLKNKEHKIKMYQSDESINFEYLTYEDDDQLYDKLKDICQKYKIPLK